MWAWQRAELRSVARGFLARPHRPADVTSASARAGSATTLAAMASRLLRVSAALRLLPAASARAVPVRHLGVPGNLASDEEQATGLERKVMEAMNKGLDPYSMFRPKRYMGTKEDPNLVPSITNKRIVGCVCEEDNSYVVWFWLHKGEAQRCPSCGAHYKLIPHELPH